MVRNSATPTSFPGGFTLSIRISCFRSSAVGSGRLVCPLAPAVRRRTANPKLANCRSSPMIVVLKFLIEGYERPLAPCSAHDCVLSRRFAAADPTSVVWCRLCNSQDSSIALPDPGRESRFSLTTPRKTIHLKGKMTPLLAPPNEVFQACAPRNTSVTASQREALRTSKNHGLQIVNSYDNVCTLLGSSAEKFHLQGVR